MDWWICAVSWQVKEYGKVNSWWFQATLSVLSTLNSLFRYEGLSLALEECFQLLSFPWTCVPSQGVFDCPSWYKLCLLFMSSNLDCLQDCGLVLIAATYKWILSLPFWSRDQFTCPRAAPPQIGCQVCMYAHTYVILFVCLSSWMVEKKNKAKMHHLFPICTSYKVLPYFIFFNLHSLWTENILAQLKHM